MSIGQIAQIGLGAVGFAFGGTTGAAVGWLVGGWLFSDKSNEGNDIMDPGAQELPGINQALRGVTIPVLFGTNRCESFHTWRKNFTPIRHESRDESGAGGKMGGSGGGGKGKGGAGGGGSVSYTYTLDAMFQIGLTDGEYFMYGGWLGAQRLNDQTIAAISQGFSNGAVVFGANANVPKEASLEFTEAYYYPGGNLSPGWTYFHGQEGINVTDAASLGMRWTHMAWVGFRGIDLGDSPSTPALQWEIGPGSGTIDLESVNFGKADRNTVLDGRSAGAVSKNGRWFGSAFSTQYVLMYINDDGTITKWTTNSNYLKQCLIDAGIDNGENFSIGETVMILPGTNFALLIGHNDSGGISNAHGFALVDLSTHDGSSTGTTPWVQSLCAGAVFIQGNSLEFKHRLSLGIGRTGIQGDDSKILMTFKQQINNNTLIVVLPTINEFKAKNVNETASASFGNRATVFPSDIGATFPGTAAGRHTSIDTAMFWFAPDLVGSAFGTDMYCYISRDLADTSNNTYITTNRDTFPDGWMIRLGLNMGDGDASNKIVFDAVVVANDQFVDGSGASVFPPTDESTGRDGGVSTNAQYRPEVTIQRWEGAEAAGAYLVIMHKMYYGSTEAVPFGTFCRVTPYLLNPLTKKFIRLGNPQSAIFDTVVDGGQPESRRFLWNAVYGIVTYSEITKVVRYTGTWDDTVNAPLDEVWVTADFGVMDIGGATDVTPPYIIRQILTDPIYGMGIAESDIDDDSFGIAVQYCLAEEILVSTKYRREQGYLRIIDLLLSLYNGYIIRRGSKIIFGLMDFGQESGATPVRTLDNDHFVVEQGKAPVEVTEGAQQDTYNRIKVNYLDRSLEYRQNFVEMNDEVDQDFRGIRAKEFPAQFVMSEKLAIKIAIRGLWSNLYARDVYAWSVGWKDMDLEPGDLITLVDSFDPKLAGGVRARITTMEEMQPGKWRCQGTQELEHVVTAQPLVNSMTNNSSGGFRRGVTGPATLFNMYELPREFQGANPVLYTGWAQSERSAGAKLWVSGDGVTFSIAADITPHTISGIFAGALPSRPRGYVERDVDVFLFPDVRSQAFNTASPAYVETFALEDGGETQRALGGTALWVGSEMVAYQTPTLIGSNHYRFERVYRGWGGTPIFDHSSGDVFWRHGGGVFVQPYNEDKIGTIIHYKVTPYNFSGYIWPVESVDAQVHTVQGTYFRPQNPGTVHVWVDSVDYDQTTLRGLSDITSLHLKAEWQDSARQEGFGTLGFGFLGYGHFTTDPLSHSWRVEVIGSGDTMVHSVVVTTPFFVYSAGQNLADNGAFRPNVAFKVTPFSNFGDSLVTETVSLDFFGV